MAQLARPLDSMAAQVLGTRITASPLHDEVGAAAVVFCTLVVVRARCRVAAWFERATEDFRKAPGCLHLGCCLPPALLALSGSLELDLVLDRREGRFDSGYLARPGPRRHHGFSYW